MYRACTRPRSDEGWTKAGMERRNVEAGGPKMRILRHDVQTKRTTDMAALSRRGNPAWVRRLRVEVPGRSSA